ncbi:MAG: DUF4411 family protein [Bryobacteraceae bacterium]
MRLPLFRRERHSQDQSREAWETSRLSRSADMYYPLDAVTEFWEWIDHQATNGRIKLPVEVLDEILAGARKKTRSSTG